MVWEAHTGSGLHKIEIYPESGSEGIHDPTTLNLRDTGFVLPVPLLPPKIGHLTSESQVNARAPTVMTTVWGGKGKPPPFRDTSWALHKHSDLHFLGQNATHI